MSLLRIQIEWTWARVQYTHVGRCIVLVLEDMSVPHEKVTVLS